MSTTAPTPHYADAAPITAEMVEQEGEFSAVTRLAEPPVRVRPAEAIVEEVCIVDERRLLTRRWHFVGSVAEWCFGLMSMLVILAVLATIPLLQFLSLGYLLEASGRVAKRGRLRDGFIGIRQAARVGSLVLGTWICLLPLRFLGEFAYDAHLIAPGSPIARGWRVFMVIATTLVVGHIVWAWFRGGKFRHFLWPAPVRLLKRLWQGGMYAQARDATWDFVAAWRLPHYFWLGLRGFAGGAAWLFFPLLLFGAATLLPEGPGPVLLSLLGGLLLTIVLLYLPFLQANFAAQQRLVAMFDVSTVRAQFKRAPLAFWIALFITLLFALPLYLLKIELIPREMAALPSLVFVTFIFPARLLAGWAVGRAEKRQEVRHFVFRWLARLSALPVAGIYVFLIYFTQYLSWNGVWSLFEQHAFLLPVPFAGM